jgi:hypothetical protein
MPSVLFQYIHLTTTYLGLYGILFVIMTNACQWGQAVAVRYLNHSHVLYNGFKHLLELGGPTNMKLSIKCDIPAA